MKTQRLKMFFSTIAVLALVVGGATGAKAQEPLPSWNDGPAKQAILTLRLLLMHSLADRTPWS
jgi:hypothetical protein